MPAWASFAEAAVLELAPLVHCDVDFGGSVGAVMVVGTAPVLTVLVG